MASLEILIVSWIQAAASALEAATQLRLREIADYSPTLSVASADAKAARRLAGQIVALAEKGHA